MIASVGVGLDLDLGLNIGIGVGMNADGVVNVFPSCCLEIFSKLSNFLV